jgi:hypothetical protein
MTAKPLRKPSSTVGRNEVIRDSRGRRVDDAYVEGAVEDAVDYVRGRGRPSLSEAGESPLLRVRVSRDLESQIRNAAHSSGLPVATWVRRSLERAVRQEH